MKKIRLAALLLSLVLALTCLNLPVFAQEESSETSGTEPTTADIPDVDGSDADMTVVYGSHTPDGAYPIHGTMQILPASKAAILYEVNTESLVYAWNADEQLYPSSLVKIMTALIAIENGDLDDTVTATWDVLNTVPIEAMKTGIAGGEELTVEQLLYCMMVGSGNDAAAVLADHIAGSQSAFVELMNRRALQLGCTGTVFTNVTGLHDDEQVTTARDMVKILRKALEYPAFAEIFGTGSYLLAATNLSDSRYLQTSNYMQSDELTDDYFDSRVTGGRTGVTNDGDRCLAVTAEEGNAQYICIILEAKSDYASNGVMTRQGSFEDAALLLDLAFEQSAAVQVLRAGQSVEQLSVENGTNDVVIGPDSNVYCVLPAPYEAEKLTVRVQMKDTLAAPVEAGEYVADYQVWYGSVCIATARLYTLNSSKYSALAQQQTAGTEEPGFDAGSLTTAFIVLGVIFAIILVLGGGLLLIRKIRGAMSKSRKRKRRKERRRSK